MGTEITWKRNLIFIRHIFLVLIFVFLFANSNAQTEKQILKKAEAYFDSSNFQTALPLYLQLHQLDSNNSIYNYAIGVCYFNSPKEKTKSIPYFEKVAKDKKSPLYKYVGLNLGQSYSQAYRFDEAKAALEKYIKGISKKSPEYQEITNQINFFKSAQELVNNPVTYPIKNLKSINSPYPEYSPVISADESVLIFTTRRPTGVSGLETDNDGQYYEDIFITTKKDDGTWSEPVGISNNINTMYHDASVGLSSDGQQLFVYKDDNGDGNIYVCTLNGNEWSTPKKLGPNINSNAFEPSACLSADGNTLYFVSDRKGGYGATDIYKSNKQPDGEWGLPVNLGPLINSDKEEDSPFIQADGKGLYYSSKGKEGLGGFDIFYSAMTEDGKWGAPKNIGYPINTTDDDLFYVLSANGKHAYYSSAKEGGLGDKDLYQVTLPSTLNIVLIKGRILIDDLDTSTIRSSIEVTNRVNDELIGIYKPNSKTGMYLIVLNQNTEYSFSINTKGFEAYTKNIDIPAREDYTEMNQEFHFYHKKADKQQDVVFYDRFTSKDKAVISPKDSIPTVISRPIITALTKDHVKSEDDTLFRNILFAVNKTILNTESMKTLDKVYIFMKETPSSHLEIEGHTDNTGNAADNMKLSLERANACKKYLIGKGIDKSRINSKGYSEKQPQFKNSTPDGRKKNRRVKLIL